MTHRLAALVVVAVAASLAGCGPLADPDAGAAPVPAVTPAKPSPTPSAYSGLGDSVKDSGDIPDPCTLLSEAEVKSLTGRGIGQIDRDGAGPGDASRFCQWQQPGGQLAVFLARTTESDFAVETAEADPVEDVGEDAFALAGHLYVLYGTVSIDVYCRGDADDENLAKAKKIAKALMPRI
ncbi:DUF3558 family protein [Couchioplanes caeruleus]|uniref:DUF3558 domain-containing protein n=2 Tax=Couchioplanes caeruleus TaxID=56438 RepID=A0A1K0GC88_9ACTN|nr:DUF3558 family protein [Couchioplanes caeruleus]OJF14858.1 hypothetical protein BG844_07495 [Couchioplanes caeruleus subsp. caeruleus]ROP32154.1 uncharacterized protein DUF3558 [Couchioplanes caeruleus]